MGRRSESRSTGAASRIARLSAARRWSTFGQEPIFERYNIKNEDDLREAATAVAEMGKNGEKRARVVPLTNGPKGITS
jgi:hypothetical protein